MAQQNLGVCSSCRTIVPVSHVVRDGRVYLHKECPTCGATDALVSTDAEVWSGKRRIWRYDPSLGVPCTLDCRRCRHNHKPAMVFVDVTNRCNMNCPICIANVPAMGFRFDPPLSYFDAVFAALSRLDPKPRINLFGGEPTVRDDLFEIIALARQHGLTPRIVTNGVRLADEDYCRRLAATQAPLLFALDGLTPDIYDRLRKNPGALAKKMKALENLKQCGARKLTIMSCVARKINEHQIGDLIRFCHENRDLIRQMNMIPLTETWEEGEFETDVATTIEDVEAIVDRAFPGETAEFWSAGLPARLEPVLRFLGGMKLTFGGVHPNCESMTLLVSDDERYYPIRTFTTGSANELMGELVDKVLRMEAFLDKLDPRRPGQRLLGLFRIAGAMLPRLVRFVNWRALMKGHPLAGALRIALDLARGRKLKEALRAHTCGGQVMIMIVLPFEEFHSVESERLCQCKAAFAYMDAATGRVGVVPVCSWSLIQKEVLRSIAQKYEAEAAVATGTDSR